MIIEVNQRSVRVDGVAVEPIEDEDWRVGIYVPMFESIFAILNVVDIDVAETMIESVIPQIDLERDARIVIPQPQKEGSFSIL